MKYLKTKKNISSADELHHHCYLQNKTTENEHSCDKYLQYMFVGQLFCNPKLIQMIY